MPSVAKCAKAGCARAASKASGKELRCREGSCSKDQQFTSTAARPKLGTGKNGGKPPGFVEILISHRIHGAGIYANIKGVY